VELRKEARGGKKMEGCKIGSAIGFLISLEKGLRGKGETKKIL